MPAFRKKPVIIEAFRAEGRTLIDASLTLHQHDLVAEQGDWIIKGVNGEMYPCKDDIFRATYEPVGKEGVWALLAVIPGTQPADDEPIILKFPGVE